MSIVESELALLRHPPVAALATSAFPAWLWSVDGSRILWANAAGAAIFGAATVNDITQRRFDTRNTPAHQIVRLAATLPTASQERLERLRGFGAGFGRALTCVCSRIVIDGKGAVLVAAREPAGPALALGERVRRLFAASDTALAAFSADGALIYASAAARTLLAGATSLSALGLDSAAATVMATGSAKGTAQLQGNAVDFSALRLGKDAARAIVLTLAPPTIHRPQQTSAVQAIEPTTNIAATDATSSASTDAQPASESSIAPDNTVTTDSVALAENTMAAAFVVPVIETLEPTTSPAETTSPPDSVAEPVSATPSPIAEPSPPSPPFDETITERRHPLRFVWQMDAEGRFGVGSDEFVELVGPQTMGAFGRPWSDIAQELKLDPDHQVARALATRETWSGIVISWPVDASDERLPVELSGLPIFDRDRSFRGYRGFGVCRDVDRINQLVRARRQRSTDFAPMPEPAPDQQAVPVPAPVTETSPAPAAPVTAAFEATAFEATPAVDRPAPSVAPAANVVPFRPSPPPDPKAPPTLSPVERRAFRELAQELTARLRGSQEVAATAASDPESLPVESPPAAEPAAVAAPLAETAAGHIVLDRIPIGILIYRHNALLFANRHFLDWSGYENPAAIEAAGGLATLFVEPDAGALAEAGGTQSLSILTQRGVTVVAEGRLFTVPWGTSSALALVLTNGQTGTAAHAAAEAAQRTAASALDAATAENRELKSILDTATDGIVTLDAQARIVTANSRASALLGKPSDELAGHDFGMLFAPESERAARDYFDRVVRGDNVLSNSLEVTAHGPGDRLVPLAMALARLGGDRFAAVFHDATGRRQIENELHSAKRDVQQAAAAKAEFLTKVSHEIRTPLNAMTGFAEVIMAERFGPIGNERYREYVRDIHNAGTHLVSMLNDLLDLSKIETGQIELNFTNVNLNELTQQCVGIMQPQASRARIIIRTSLTPSLPRVIADERSLRQIVLNLLANSIRFTGPGGQVIVSTVFSDAREAVLRVRDTGVGMSEKDIQAALEPFRQTATAGSWGSGGTGFGLPLTKALAEANRGHFSLKSAPNAGTLVEIAFPPNRIVAE